jgi:hypothetical protein
MIVVPVLITNCQVSEKPKNGPEIAQTNTIPNAIVKAGVEPVALHTTEANLSNPLL